MLYSLNMTKEPVNPDFSDCPLVIVIFSGVGGGGGGGGGLVDVILIGFCIELPVSKHCRP